ncbi:MAG: hypothetical protein AAF527_11120 [Pseudomonadota bacterium]
MEHDEKNTSTEANRQFLRLQLGVADISDIIQWADQCILVADTPTDPLIDLSLSKRTDWSSVYSALATLGGQRFQEGAIKSVVREFCASKPSTREVKLFAARLSRIILPYLDNYSERLHRLAQYDDWFAGAEEGWETRNSDKIAQDFLAEGSKI